MGCGSNSKIAPNIPEKKKDTESKGNKQTNTNGKTNITSADTDVKNTDGIGTINSNR